MDPAAWFAYILMVVGAPYVILAAYRYAGNLFRRL
jgi:hypothetical protein